MAKATKKSAGKKATAEKKSGAGEAASAPKKSVARKKSAAGKKSVTGKKAVAGKKAAIAKTPSVISAIVEPLAPPPPQAIGASSAVLDRLWAVIDSRRAADPNLSHSARLLARGTAKVAQKFGEEAVECVIEATLGHPEGLVAESADVLYHLLVLWVDGGVRPADVWAELQRREGVSGIAEKASRARSLPQELNLGTSKIP